MFVTVVPTNLPSTNNTEEQELLNRLKAQFGDLDLTQIMHSSEINDDDDDSTIEEPSPEELKAWQEAQFQKGKARLEERHKQETASALQRRRAELRKKKKERQGPRGGVNVDDDDDDDDWEQVAASPDLKGQSSVFFPMNDVQGNEILGVHPLLQQLSEGDTEILGTSWLKLYSSVDGDGLSFFKILETLRGYPGPTVMLLGAVPASSKKIGTTTTTNITDTTPTTIGFYTTSPWIESTHFTGSSECFLFAMDESNVHFFHPRTSKCKDKEQYYMYCHPSNLNINSRQRTSPSNKTDGLVHGIGVGGTPMQPRLHLTETLENCRAMEYCHLFDNGDLLLGHGKDTLNYFDVDCLEIWAVGGTEWITESLLARQAQRDIIEATTYKARKVDKQQFLKDFHGGLLSGIPNGFFSHVQHTSDRCDM